MNLQRIKWRQKSFAWYAAALFIVASTIYWGCIASDRYVSEAHVFLKKANLTSQSPTDLLSLIAGSGESHDLLLLRDHLLSVDMMNRLDGELNLRDHFSDHTHDYISRLKARDISIERFQRYYQSMVIVTYDDYAQVLVISVQAYTAKMAQAIAQRLVVEGERYMNKLENKTGEEQVRYVQAQVEILGQRMSNAHAALLAFQNKHGLASPAQAAESVSAITSRLEARIAELQAKRRTMEGYLTPSAPDMVQVDREVGAAQMQLDAERKRLAANQGNGLNALIEQQGRLQAQAALADDLYKTALVALESARVEATRKINTVAVLQSANLPQEPWQPRRLYNIALSIIGALMLAGVFNLVAAIIRDHKD